MRVERAAILGIGVVLGRYAAIRFNTLRLLWVVRGQGRVDPLTSLDNRRVFHEDLREAVGRGHRRDRPLTLILLDIDDFAAINADRGHVGGDAALVELSRCIREVVGSGGSASRIGGDEFAILLPDSIAESAERLVARLQSWIAAAPGAELVGLSLRAGIADLKPGDEPETLYQRADEALYRDKGSDGGDSSGVREPRRPKPSEGQGGAEAAKETG